MLFESFFIDILNMLPYRCLRKEKNDMRAKLLQRRRILRKEEVEQCSHEVVEQIALLPEFQNAKVVLMYYPIQNEIDLRQLITYYSDKTFLLPVTHRKSLELRQWTGEEKMHHGKHGIPEPKSETYKGKPDIILVPGVGFDKEGKRLGRGKGYYDRFLKRYSGTPKIGVGYKFQQVKDIPHNKHDIKMDKLILARTQ